MNTRNQYNALTVWPKFAAALSREAEAAGAFTSGIEADRKRRGQAVNTDLFGHDEDRDLIVIQVRQAIFHPRRYTEVRKNYLLIGHNEETGVVFAHPVISPARSKTALSSPTACVDYVLAKIWGCRVEDLGEIHRQGDIAFVPVRNLPAGASRVEGPVLLRGTHKLTGDEIYADGARYYVRKRGHLVHKKRQHVPVTVRGGLFRVQVGQRASLWDFTIQKGD